MEHPEPVPVGLSPEKRTALAESQRALNDLLPEFDRAERCGINCKQWRQHHAQLTRNITNILTEYPER